MLQGLHAKTNLLEQDSLIVGDEIQLQPSCHQLNMYINRTTPQGRSVKILHMAELRAEIDVYEGTINVYAPGSLVPCFTATFYLGFSNKANCNQWFMNAIDAPKSALPENVVLTFLNINSALEMSVDSVSSSCMTGRWPKPLRTMVSDV